LGLAADKTQTQELIGKVEEFFKAQSNKGLCIAFILEDIEYYIENSSQRVLYKILDMI
jgi:hypothetical protein